MKPQTTVQQNKSGYVRTRLTMAEQARVKERAEARGLTTSEWVRVTLMAALESSAEERRLMSFIAAQTLAIRLSLEEWQAGKDLTEPDVRARVERLALQASREFMATKQSASTQKGEAA